MKNLLKGIFEGTKSVKKTAKQEVVKAPTCPMHDDLLNKSAYAKKQAVKVIIICVVGMWFAGFLVGFALGIKIEKQKIMKQRRIGKHQLPPSLDCGGGFCFL